MRREIETESALDMLHSQWSEEGRNEASRIINRIEELPRLEDVTAADIEWLVDGIFAQGALHMLTSEPGAGKSTLMSAVAAAVSRGTDFMGRATSKCPVLLLDAENPSPAILERFRRLRIQTHEDFGQWVGEDAPQAGDAVVLQWVERCDPKPLIIIDSVIAFHPGAENDSNETRKYMAQYRKLTALGASPVLLHHIGKGESSRDYRGSSDYKASIDVGYKLKSLGDGTRLPTLELRPFKQRFSVSPLLNLKYDDGVFSVDHAESRKTKTERLYDLLKENPGIIKTDSEMRSEELGLGRNRARDFLEKGVEAGTVRVEAGMNNRKLHYYEPAKVAKTDADE